MALRRISKYNLDYNQSQLRIERHPALWYMSVLSLSDEREYSECRGFWEPVSVTQSLHAAVGYVVAVMEERQSARGCITLEEAILFRSVAET